MWADPKPNDFVIIDNSDGPIVDIDSCRKDRSSGMNLFEVKAWMVGVELEALIGFPRLQPNIDRQSFKQ